MSLTEALKRIYQLKERWESRLDLSNLDLRDFPFQSQMREIGKQVYELKTAYSQIDDDGIAAITENLKNLVSLDISSNNIGDKNVVVLSEGLKNLVSLNIRNNGIGQIGAIAISQNLKNLSSLDISYNTLDNDSLALISEGLKELVSLDISSNLIDDEGAKIISENLKNLTYLKIADNRISDRGAIDISQDLKNLTSLDIGYNAIGDKGVAAISQNLKNLISLELSFTEISYKGLVALCRNLKNLTSLHINDNDIGDRGAVIISQNLKNLKTLSVDRNQIGDEGALAISQNLGKLDTLYIRNNSVEDRGIREIYNAFKDKWIDVWLQGNHTSAALTSATSDWETLKQYFNSISGGKKIVELYALNILLLGNTLSGKSSLQQFYLDGGKVLKAIRKDRRTWGITHKTIESSLQSNLRLSFWDFGGQEYFHGTHRLFIGGRNSLYLVLWEQQYEESTHVAKIDSRCKSEIGDDCYPASYWLGTIRYFDKNEEIAERVMVLQSKIDTQEPISIPWPAFLNKKRFELRSENSLSLSVWEASQLGAKKTKEYYKALWTIFTTRFETLIKKYKSRFDFNEDMLKILGSEGLNKWRKMYGLALSKSDFLKLCHQFYQEADDFIMQYMEDSGDILVFKDNPILKDVVFIHPENLLNNIYSILNTKVKKRGGTLTKSELKEKDIELLNVMLEMDLIFENPAIPGEYIAPQFMNENAEISKLLNHLRRLLKMAFSIRFPDFMPRGVITRFISKKGKLSVDGVFWKYGVMYHHKTSNANDIKVLVEADESNRFIRVYADDRPGKYEALKEVYNWFVFSEYSEESKEKIEKDESQARIDLKLKQVLPPDRFPPGDLELSADGQNYASIEEINKAIDQNAPKTRNIHGDYMPLDSIFYVLLNKTTAMPKKIFFSYSRYDREYREEFEVHFATLKRQGLIATWFDGEIDAGIDANAKIMKELENADIILCLLSPQFMANDYIWNTEMQKAKDTGKTVIPITIRACDYKKYFEGYFDEDKQGFLTQKQFDRGQNDDKIKKRDIIWIASEQHSAQRDEYYNYIVEELKKIIER